MIALVALMFIDRFNHYALSVNIPYNSSVTSINEKLTLQACKLHPDGEDCNYNKYIVQLKAAYNELFIQTTAPPLKKPVRIETVSSKLPYVSVFEQYIMKSRYLTTQHPSRLRSWTNSNRLLLQAIQRISP